jgi:hypothetical protein
MGHVVRTVVPLLCTAVSAGAGAMTIEHLKVGEQGPAYVVELEAVLDAPPDAVMAVLQDYSRYPELDDRVKAARLEGKVDGRPVLYTRLRGCVGSAVCRDVERYELLTERERLLVAEEIPGRGDVARGRTETRLEPRGKGTRVSYRTFFEPAFWMPRWMVRSAMRRTLEEGTRSMFANVETIAREKAGP